MTLRLRTEARRRTREHGAKRAGFTLVEMLLVVTVVGIVAGMALPKIDYDRYRVDSAGRVARNVLQNAQRMAILRQTNVIVSFDVSGRQMRIIEDANNNNTIDTGERVTTRPIEEGAGLYVPPRTLNNQTATTAVEGSALTTVGGLPSIVFLRDGAASADVALYISGGRRLPNLFRAVRVTKATGRADYSRYDGTTWKKGSI
jgi:prepilin-type N-terminal cleavage/methylation domain-containing protein